MRPAVLELRAGGGGQAAGLGAAGFDHAGAVEIDAAACATLRLNGLRNVIEGDLRSIDGGAYSGIDLIAAGVPCPPFSVAGRQLGADDERDMFPATLNLVRRARPRAVMLENVPGLATEKFKAYRDGVAQELEGMGFVVRWRTVTSCEFGLAQLRPRFVLVALLPEFASSFSWPTANADRVTVGEALHDLMSARGWPGADAWRARACRVGPTLVGGSKKHGGADLGPTRAKAQWALLGVDGHGVADDAPGPDFPADGSPKITTRMAARLQGFPEAWRFSGRKTSVYRQVANAFPSPVARAFGLAIASALRSDPSRSVERLTGAQPSVE